MESMSVARMVINEEQRTVFLAGPAEEGKIPRAPGLKPRKLLLEFDKR